MERLKTLLRAGRVVDPETGLDERVDVLVVDGVIAEIGDDLAVEGAGSVDCTDCVVTPGFVDAHVHLREPGREDEETVASGTRAAAKGGFSAVCAMPNTEPPCDTGSAVRFLLERAEDAGAVRVHVVGAASAERAGERLAEIGDMVMEGAVAISDDGDWVADSGMMRLVMDYAKRFDVPVVTHCQDSALTKDGVVNEGAVSTRLGLPGWPATAEDIAVARDLHLARLTGCRLHIAHLSTAGALDLVRAAKSDGVDVTCEVTPHHLFLSEDCLLGYDTNLKMNPPLRTEDDRRALLEGVSDGTVDCIATDHAPHAPHEKEAEFELAPFGTTGLETALSLIVTHLVDGGGMDWAAVVRLLAIGPRRSLGLPEQRLEVGAPADITVIDPAVEWTVAPDGFESRSRNSAFLGHRLKGRARHVMVGGALALLDGVVT